MATTTPAGAPFGSTSDSRAALLTARWSGCRARCAGDRSSTIHSRAPADRQRGSAAMTDRARVPGPAPQSITVNGAGSPSCAHHPSRARARTAPNSGPTSGAVRKCPERPPARPPRM